MFKILVLFICFSVLPHRSFASSPFATSYVVPAWDSEFFLLMRPLVSNNKFSGVISCFEITEEGKFRKFWEVEEDYSFDGHLFLGDGGNVLIKIVEIIQPQPDPGNHILGQQTILRFYRRGKVFKNVNIRDVVNIKEIQEVATPHQLSTHRIFDLRAPTTPLMGRLLDFKFFTEGDKVYIRQMISDETEIFCIKTVQLELLVFKVSDGSLIYRKKTKIESVVSD